MELGTHKDLNFTIQLDLEECSRWECYIRTMNQNQISEIYKALLDFGNTLDPAELFSTLVPEAAKLVLSDPYAFALATCLDRGTKAIIIWTIPYDIKKALGHLDPQRINLMSLEELAGLLARLPRRPRYINDAPRTIKELTRIVVEECNGDASGIWKSKRASEVKRILMSIHGVGPGIANMGVLLIERAFNIRFDDLDHSRMDIKPDVHTKRVLYRLGVSGMETEQDAIEAARRLNPKYPGEIDGALWLIGRKWCHASNPNCPDCPMTRSCSKKIS